MQFVMMSSMSMGMGIGTGTGDLGMGQQPNQWEGAQGSEDCNAEGMEWTEGGIGTIEEAQGQGGPDKESTSLEKEVSPIPGDRSVGSTGKMQKVGDRWVFVRS